MAKESIVPAGRESWYEGWHYSPAIVTAIGVSELAVLGAHGEIRVIARRPDA